MRKGKVSQVLRFISLAVAILGAVIITGQNAYVHAAVNVKKALGESGIVPTDISGLFLSLIGVVSIVAVFGFVVMLIYLGRNGTRIK